jgi:hypothetical protein
VQAEPTKLKLKDSDADIAASALAVLNGTSKVMGKNGPVELNHTERAYFIASLIATNREEGLAELAKLPPGGDTQDDYSRIFEALIQESPNKASNTAVIAYDLPAGSNRDAALNTVISRWGETDPKAVLDWAGALAATDSGPLNSALSDLASAHGDPALAAQYLDQLADATARAHLIGQIATVMAQTDPAATLDWLDKTATGDAYDNSVIKVMGNLAMQDPVRAAALMDKITEPGVRDAAIATLATNWASTDIPAALAWLQSLPDGDSAIRDGLVQKLAQVQNSGQ